MVQSSPNGPIAQLDRASDFESEGWAFESLWDRQFNVCLMGKKQIDPHCSVFHILDLFPLLSFRRNNGLDRYNSLITSTLVEDGADCEIESFYLSVTTKLNSVFLVECSKSSYLNEIEITCALSPDKQCEVTRY